MYRLHKSSCGSSPAAHALIKRASLLIDCIAVRVAYFYSTVIYSVSIFIIPQFSPKPYLRRRSRRNRRRQRLPRGTNKSKGNEINRLIERPRRRRRRRRRASLSTRSLEASAYDKVAAGRTSLIKFIESRDDATLRSRAHGPARRAALRCVALRIAPHARA